MVAVQTFAVTQEMIAAQLTDASVQARLAAKEDILALQDGTAAPKGIVIRWVVNVAVLDIIARLAIYVCFSTEFKNAAQMICVPRTSIRG
jgi:hypothetical protein